MDKKQKEILNAFLNKYKKQCYMALGVLLLAVVLIVVIVNGGKNKKNDTEAIQRNAYPEVRTLIENYYKAAAKGSVKKVGAYATPISDNEKEYIKLFSKYVEKYSIQNIYTKQAVDSNSIMVSVEMSIKFKGVKTEAPGLDFFYVTGMDSKELYIVNLYSQFNARTKEYKTEKQVSKCISEYENLEEVRQLQEEVQTAYEKAVEKDEKLDVMVNRTIEDAVSDWMGTITLAQNQTPPESALYSVASGKTEKEDETGKEDKSDKEEKSDKDEKDQTKEDDQKETSEDEKKEDEFKEEATRPEVQKVTVVEYVKTKEEVNLRKGASTSKDAVCMLNGNVKLKVLSINVWGEWTYVKTKSGKKGYVRNDFLKTVDNKYTATGKEGYPKKNHKYELAEKSNLLTKMKKSGKVISSLAEGTEIKVIASYVNGYSKVKTNGRTGYLLTEKIKLK